jgi:ankyrin repeat protein
MTVGKQGLFLQLFRGHSEAAHALLGAGADANMSRNDGRTALMLSALEKQDEVTRILLNAGADANLR